MSVKLIKAFGFILQFIVVMFAFYGFKSVSDITGWHYDIPFIIIMWVMIDLGSGLQRTRKVTDL